MEAPLVLLKFLAKASLNAIGGGVAGDFVVEALPGIARDVWAWWGKGCDETQRRADLQALAQVPSAEVRKAVSQAVEEVARDKPAEVRVRLTTYLGMVPGAIHLSLRRPTDPKGVTVPPNLALQKAEDLLPFLPQRLPRFNPGERPLAGVDWQVVQLLGVGGFGEVWRARNPHFENMPHVALKFCLDPSAQERLLKYEAAVLNQVMSQGGHPGIVRLRQTYLSAEPPCLEYEFVAGGDLAGLMYQVQRGSKALLPELVARIMFKLAKTMAYAHRLNPPIVHRDLKPANILVQKLSDGKVTLRIADFGIGGVAATRAIEHTRQGSTGQFLMTALKGSYTPLYASPQQMAGENPHPGDDVHALGVIWYQLLLGDLSKGAPAGKGWWKHLSNQGVSEEALNLMQECFEGNVADRLADATILAQRLETLLKPEPGPTSVVPPPSTMTPRPDVAFEAVTLPPANPTSGPSGKEDVALDSGVQVEIPTIQVSDTTDSNPATAALSKGATCLERGEYGPAIKALTRALGLDDRLTDAYRQRAKAYLATKKVEEALKDLSKVVSLEPKSPASYLERGKVYHACGNLDKAISDFTNAIIHDPQPLAAYLARGRAHADKGLDDLAFADFEAALKLDPAASDVYQQRGEVRLRRGEHQQALADFHEAARLRPSNARSCIGRGKVYLHLGKPDEALAEFIQATQSDPGCAEGYLGRGLVYVQRGNDLQAVADFSQALALDKQSGEAYLLRAQAYGRLGKLTKAIADWSQAIKRNPRDPELYLERGDMYGLCENTDAALKDFNAAVKLDKNSAKGYFRRGLVYLFSGKPGHAANNFTRGLELAPEETEAYIFRGQAYYRKGRLDEAIADANECIRRNQHLAAAHNVRGNAQTGKKEYEQALVDLNEAIRLEPQCSIYYSNRGILYHQQGKYGAAVADFTEAIKLEPKNPEFYLNRSQSYDKQGEKDKALADRTRASKLPGGKSKTTTKEQEPKKDNRADSSVSLAALLAGGYLPAPLPLFRNYKGQRLEATLLPDGKVEFQGAVYDTCSRAAEYARKTVTRRRMSTNGWTFWQYLGTDATLHLLDDARHAYTMARAACSPTTEPPAPTAPEGVGEVSSGHPTVPGTPPGTADYPCP